MANTDGRAVFASYNIHKCVGSDRRFDPGRVMKVIAEIGADVIALQEADRRFGDRAGLLDLPTLEREAGLIPVPVRPAKVRHRGHGWHGNVVLVREGLVRDLRQISLPGLEPRGALVVDLDLALGSVRVVAAHLGLFRQSRLLQVEALLEHVGETTDRPVVLMGDLNEWRFQRRSALRGFAHGFGPVMPGVPTFPAYFPMLALDRVMANPRGIIEALSAHDSPLARVASDHLPLRALVRLDGEVGARDAAPPHFPHTRSRRRALLDRLLPESRV